MERVLVVNSGSPRSTDDDPDADEPHLTDGWGAARFSWPARRHGPIRD